MLGMLGMWIGGYVIVALAAWGGGLLLGRAKGAVNAAVGLAIAGLIIAGFGAFILFRSVNVTSLAGIYIVAAGVLLSACGLLPALIGGGAACQAALRNRQTAWAVILALGAVVSVSALPVSLLLGYFAVLPTASSNYGAYVLYVEALASTPLVIPLVTLLYVVFARPGRS